MRARTTNKKPAPKIVAIFIAYRAAKTLSEFYHHFPKHLVDDLLLVDDASPDGTFALAKSLGIRSYRNPVNLGYGGNMKRAIDLALADGADIIIDIHPDGEYKPTAIPAALRVVNAGAALVLGNRFTTATAPLESGMYLWKLLPIRALNLIDRFVLGVRINDLHQGFRVYTRQLLEQVNYRRNANSYLFSFELIAQAVFHRLRIAEVPVETRYQGAKRGASLKSSVLYTLGTFKVLLLFLLAKLGYRGTLFASPAAPERPRRRARSESG